MKKLYIFLIFIILILNPVSYVEGSCGSSNCSLISGSQDGTTSKGNFVFDLSFRYIRQENKKRGSTGISSEVLVPKVDFENKELEPEHHRELRTINKLAQLDISYGLTERITLSLNVPFFNDRLHEHDDGVTATSPEGEFTNQDGTTGFGDVTLLAKYLLLQTTKHLFAGGTGIKFPTGEYRLRNSEGHVNEPTIMPGTGSFDAILSGLYNYSFIPNKLDIFTAISHRFTTENSLNYHFGNRSFIDGGLRYKMTDKVQVSAQINARISRRDTFLDQDVPSTGGEFVNFTPGIRLFASENVSIYSHIQIPIHQKVNEVNLVPDYGLLMGISYGF